VFSVSAGSQSPPPPAKCLTDGLEAVEREGNAEEVLPVGHAAVGVVVASRPPRGGEVRRAVDQPEALLLIQQDDTWGNRDAERVSDKRRASLESRMDKHRGAAQVSEAAGPWRRHSYDEEISTTFAPKLKKNTERITRDLFWYFWSWT